jgi:hypothetical protein
VIYTLKGCRPRPLDDGAGAQRIIPKRSWSVKHIITHHAQIHRALQSYLRFDTKYNKKPNTMIAQ